MINHIPTVAVLMSTYNGEKYIREQIDSIFNQDNVEVKLFVRDDGSTDGTVGILREYAQKFPVEIILDGENVRPGESFMRLVYMYANTPGIEYYAFADQDDIWLPKKIDVAIKKLHEIGNDVPALYSSNQYIYIDGKNKGLRYKEPQRIDLISHITRNTIAGCTFVFNKLLAQVVATAGRPDPRILRYRLHDSWMMLVAICCGRVVYDKNSNMLYRIHEDNVVGVKRISLSDKMNRLRRMFKKDSSNIRMISAKELIRLYPILNDKDKQVLHLIADYKDSNKNKWMLLLCNEVVKGSIEHPMMFRIKVILGVL